MTISISSSAKERTIGYFDHNYKGVNPGFSSLETVYKQLGKPLRVEPAGGGSNYVYNKVIVNFPGGNEPKVNTIIIFNDNEYIDPNGFKLGDDIANIISSIGAEYDKNTLTDIKKGVIYWHNGKSVNRIVLPYAFYID